MKSFYIVATILFLGICLLDFTFLNTYEHTKGFVALGVVVVAVATPLLVLVLIGKALEMHRSLQIYKKLAR